MRATAKKAVAPVRVACRKTVVTLPLDDDDDAPAPPAKRSHAVGGRKEPTAAQKKSKRELSRLAREEEESEDASPAPTRKSKIRELAEVETKPARFLKSAQDKSDNADPEATKKILRSRFGKRADAIIEMLDVGETDGAITTVQRTLLQTLVDVLPITEHAVRASSGRYGVYQFNQTISQIRELLNDIQASRDKGLLGQSIVDRCVRPAFLDVAAQIVLAFTTLNADASSRMSPEDAREYRKQVEAMKRQLADYLMNQYRSVSESVVASLS